MPANMMKANAGSIFMVTGSRRATVSAGPMPGRMPTKVPSVTPTSAHNSPSQLSAKAKPSSRKPKDSTASEQALEHAGRQRQAKTAREADIGGSRKRQPDDAVAQKGPAVETGRDQYEEQG